MTKQIEIGRVLSAGTSAFVVGCRVGRPQIPAFGTLVRAPIGQDAHVYGLIYDLRIQDDGLVRQLVTAENISQEVLLDNRERRIVPVEMSVVVGGNSPAKSGTSSHLVPRSVWTSSIPVTTPRSSGSRRSAALATSGTSCASRTFLSGSCWQPTSPRLKSYTRTLPAGRQMRCGR
jgi:hypothetical protein